MSNEENLIQALTNVFDAHRIEISGTTMWITFRFVLPGNFKEFKIIKVNNFPQDLNFHDIEDQIEKGHDPDFVEL